MQTLNGIFSAGLDFREIYQPDKARLHELHRSLQEFWIKLHGCAPVTIAAINVSQLFNPIDAKLYTGTPFSGVD